MLSIPDNKAFHLSKPIVVIILTTVMLAGLLVTNTIRNLQREQKIMENFLLDEGLTLIRSFEAGARTTMMHEMMSADPPIVTLVNETIKARRIAFITIVAGDGTVVASAGDHDPDNDAQARKQVLANGKPVTRLLTRNGDEPVFEITAIFQTLPPETMPMMGMMGMRHHWQAQRAEMALLEQGNAVIHLGLRTGEFIKARQQDVTHSLIMGGLLFLLGTAGFYFLFLYQGMRVTRTTLANMKLYTRNIIESMPDGLITLDSQGRIVSCNPRALEFTGMRLDQLKGQRPEELFAGWSATPLDREDSVSTYTFVHADATEVPVEISGSPLQDEEGRIMGAVLLLRDLREIRAMEKQLARSQRLAALGRMAAGIAHEIRNPLGTLRGFAQYFNSQAKDDASREYATIMVGEVDRLNSIISSLLQFSRPRDPDFGPVDLDKLFAKTALLLQSDFMGKEIELRQENGCAATIEADADLLLQVLLNLLKNALAASNRGDVITLSCEEDEDNVAITVTDNGIGMSREEREQMFDPFFTTKKSGTGLGLAVSHQIIEQHRGVCTVRSSRGRGTSITLTLPKRQNPAREDYEKDTDRG